MMKQWIKRSGLLILRAGVSVMFSSCGIFSSLQKMREDEKVWKRLEASIDEEVAAKDITSFHNARYQLRSRIIMSDMAEGSADRIMELFSERVIAEVGEKELRESVEKLSEVMEGELLFYETQKNGGSGHRGGKGMTTEEHTIVIYTDMDIYEMRLSYVTEDSSSKDGKANLANLGLHRMVLFPVSALYGQDGLGSSPYPDYLEKEGAFWMEADQAAREVVYPDETYTGYSIAYLQEFHYQSAVKKDCEELMGRLASLGFVGDITKISYATQEEFEEAYEAEYRMIVADETGKRFFVRSPKYENDVCVRRLGIADENMRVLYEDIL